VTELYLQSPWALALLPLPLLLVWLWQRRPADSKLEKFIARHLWPRLISRPQSASSRQAPWLLALVWVLLCLALAGPGLLKFNKQNAERSAANVVFIVDISPSMGAEDVVPSRLEEAKKLLADFSQQLGAHRLALIAFSANAYTIQPLSHDLGAFRHFLTSLDPSLASVAGSNLGRALQLARDAFTKAETKEGLVVLVSDGELQDANALAEVKQLTAAGHHLYTLGIGTEQGAPVPLARGRLVQRQGKLHTSQLQADTLRALAAAGGGTYQYLTPQAWPSIQAQIDKLQQTVYHDEIRRQGGLLLFPYLVIAALLLLFWQSLQRPYGLAIVLCAMLVSNSNPTQAAPWNETKGLKQLNAEQFEPALKTYSELDNYNGLIGKGVAAYGLGDWQNALTAFQHAYELAKNDQDKARAAYNQGNALTQLGRIDEAKASFEQALLWQPDHKGANRNLALIKRAEQEYAGAQAGKSKQEKAGDGTGSSKNNRADQGDAEGQGRGGDQGKGALKQQPSATVQQALEQWSKNGRLPPDSSRRAQQQFTNLKEESRDILMRRFEIEDKRAAGLVETKPW